MTEVLIPQRPLGGCPLNDENHVAYWPTRERNPNYQPVSADSSPRWCRNLDADILAMVVLVIILGCVLGVIVRKRKRDDLVPMASVNTSPVTVPQSSSDERSGVGRSLPVQLVPTVHSSRNTGGSIMKRSQRDVMRSLYRKHGNKEEVLVSQYAEAERNGEVERKSNDYHLGAEEYARALYADGVRKGWITET
jgi:hypothetical protein